MKNLICVTCVYFLFSFSVIGQDGSPDVTFGDNGVVLTSFGESNLVISAISQGESGRIAVLGTEYPVLIDTIHFIQVYNEDGTVDGSFGDNGVVKIIDNIGAPIDKIKVLSDNSIVFGYGGSARKILPNGAVDTAFGSNGSIDIGLSLTDSLGHVIHPDGSIYVCGRKVTGDKEFVIKKFDSDGVIDVSFAQNGTAFINVPSNKNGFYHSFHVNPEDDSLFLNVVSNNSSGSVTRIYKLLPNGMFDSSYGSGGLANTTSLFDCRYNSFVAKDGSVYVGCTYFNEATEEFNHKTSKINPDGAINSSFGTNGVLEGYNIRILQPNGRFIAASDIFYYFEGGIIPSLSRFFLDGHFDESFQFQYDYTELGNYVMSSENDKLLIAGGDIWYNGPDINLFVARYNNTPLNIDENSTQNLSVFPNPTDGIVTISCSTCELIGTSYTLVDATGKKVMEGTFRSTSPSIAIKKLRAGMYFLRIQDNTYKILKN